MTTQWFFLADYLDLEANLLGVPYRELAIANSQQKELQNHPQVYIFFLKCTQSVWGVSKQGVKSLAAGFECTKWLATCISLEAVCMTGGENTRAHSASKHGLLQAGVFRATGENQSPRFKKTHFTTTFHVFCQICLLRSKIHTGVTNITAQEWKGSTCLVGDAATPLEIISRCHSNCCGNSWGWACF